MFIGCVGRVIDGYNWNENLAVAFLRPVHQPHDLFDLFLQLPGTSKQFFYLRIRHFTEIDHYWRCISHSQPSSSFGASREPYPTSSAQRQITSVQHDHGYDLGIEVDPEFLAPMIDGSLDLLCQRSSALPEAFYLRRPLPPEFDE